MTSGTGSSGSCGPGNWGPGPGLIINSGTGSGTQIQNLRDSGPGLTSEKSGTRDWDRDWSKYPGLYIFLPRFLQLRDLRDLPENPGLGQGPGLEILKSEIRDWDRDPDLWDAEFRDSTIWDCPGD